MNLAEGLSREIQRVSEMLHYYDDIPTGKFAATMIRQDLERAHLAVGANDVVAMAQVYQSLKETNA